MSLHSFVSFLFNGRFQKGRYWEKFSEMEVVNQLSLGALDKMNYWLPSEYNSVEDAFSDLLWVQLFYSSYTLLWQDWWICTSFSFCTLKLSLPFLPRTCLLIKCVVFFCLQTFWNRLLLKFTLLVKNTKCWVHMEHLGELHTMYLLQFVCRHFHLTK